MFRKKKSPVDPFKERVSKHLRTADELVRKKKYDDALFEIEFAFELVDFLEDWLINHLMIVDRKYIKCFHEHGLK